MKYKLCVCDMDGTLLNSDGLISNENEKALKRLEKLGVKIMIASGRVDLMVKTFIKQLDINGYTISCNGGLVRDLKRKEILYSKIIKKDMANKIVKYCFANSIDFLIYTTDMVYSNKTNLRANKYEKMNENLEYELKLPLEYIDSSFDVHNLDVLKVLLIVDIKDIKPLNDYFSVYDDLTVVSSANGLLDIMANGISKGNSLDLVAKELDICLDEVIAFGDNFNDIDMLKIVGMPIVMENASEEIKSFAKYVTKSNDNNGIAYAINKLIVDNI